MPLPLSRPVRRVAPAVAAVAALASAGSVAPAASAPLPATPSASAASSGALAARPASAGTLPPYASVRPIGLQAYRSDAQADRRQPRNNRRPDTLLGRAVLPNDPTVDASCPAKPEFGRQPVGGFSALLAGPRPGTYWAMPDNGYGGKGNSCNFLLRVYVVTPDLLTARGGTGTVRVGRFVQLRDPDRHVPFEIEDAESPRRWLTGGDFDPESMRVAPDGTFWFGDEFGPFLLHTDRTGKVLEPPIPTPGVRAPENELPAGTPGLPDVANLRSSSGFEGMALSANGRYLYPSLERALNGQDPRLHTIFEYDLRRRSYTGRTWTYRAAPAVPPAQDHVIGDLTALDRNRLLVIERDFLQGDAARFAKVVLVDLRQSTSAGVLRKRTVLDLLDIRDPNRLSLRGPVRPGDTGLGNPFRFPYVTTEAVLPVGGNRLVVVNDNNFGGVGGRNPTLPDYTDFISVRVPDLRDPVRRR